MTFDNSGIEQSPDVKIFDTSDLIPEIFNPEEMAKYGLDPTKLDDRQEWINTTPPSGVRVEADYSEDTWAFGSPGTKT